MKYTRLIVCGDSYSEGMSDEMVNGQYRGWADRIADVMAKEAPGFTYGAAHLPRTVQSKLQRWR